MSEKVNPFAQKSAEKTENSAPKIGEIVPKSETKSAKISAKNQNQNLNQVQNDVFAQNQTQNPQNPNQFAPNFAEKPKKSRKKLIIILSSVGGFLILALAAFLIWWFAFFDNDSAILRGAFDKILQQKYANVDMEVKISRSSSQNLTMKMQIAGDEENTRMSFSLDVAGISAKVDGFATKNGDFYFKINDLQEIFATILKISGENSAEISAQISPIISKIDSKWIKISAKDLTNLLKSSGQNYDFDALMKCSADYSKAAQKNIDKISKTFSDSNLFNFERVGTDQFGAKYEISIGGKISEKDAAKSLKKLSAALNYDELYDCMNDAGFAVQNPYSEENLDKMLEAATDKTLVSNSDDSVPIYVWIDRFSREPRRAEISAKNDSAEVNFTLKMNFDKPENLSAPKNFTNLTDLQKDLQNMLSESGANQEISALISGNSANSTEEVYKTAIRAQLEKTYPEKEKFVDCVINYMENHDYFAQLAADASKGTAFGQEAATACAAEF